MKEEIKKWLFSEHGTAGLYSIYDAALPGYVYIDYRKGNPPAIYGHIPDDLGIMKFIKEEDNKCLMNWRKKYLQAESDLIEIKSVRQLINE
tara:strand:+ start:839 stop:1111 length:273 start_codon:yes stop_codon:yes gene_type:complete